MDISKDPMLKTTYFIPIHSFIQENNKKVINMILWW